MTQAMIAIGDIIEPYGRVESLLFFGDERFPEHYAMMIDRHGVVSMMPVEALDAQRTDRSSTSPGNVNRPDDPGQNATPTSERGLQSVEVNREGKDAAASVTGD